MIGASKWGWALLVAIAFAGCDAREDKQAPAATKTIPVTRESAPSDGTKEAEKPKPAEKLPVDEAASAKADAGGGEAPAPSEPPTVEITVGPGEACDDGQHVLASATLKVGGAKRELPDPGFDTEVCCAPFADVESPPGTTLKVAKCEPWSCGGGCLRTTQVLFVPHEAPDQARWFELSCNENLSAVPAGTVNDACDELEHSRDALVIVRETTESKSCDAAHGGDEGLIESATVRRDRLELTAKGITHTEGEPEPYHREVWGCAKE